MTEPSIEIKEFHWLMDMLQTIDIGLVVVDRNYQVKVWNSFMESHSGQPSSKVKDHNLFDCFEELPEDWLKHKANTVFTLKCHSFMTWEQRPYLFRFKNYRPITGTEEFMYQNITISPLASLDGEISHIAIIIYDVTDIAANRKALESANAELAHLSRTDRLTNLYNRGHWEECLAREFSRYQRYDTTCSVVMFDIDHFKQVNDTYGHQAGDGVIRAVAEVTRKSLRKTDIAGRYGGEEFGIILGNTEAKAAEIFCERLRKEIEALNVNYEGQEIKFTVSLGISEAKTSTQNYTEWLEQADKALYVSKENGRNKTSMYDID